MKKNVLTGNMTHNHWSILAILLICIIGFASFSFAESLDERPVRFFYKPTPASKAKLIPCNTRAKIMLVNYDDPTIYYTYDRIDGCGVTLQLVPGRYAMKVYSYLSYIPASQYYLESKIGSAQEPTFNVPTGRDFLLDGTKQWN